MKVYEAAKKFKKEYPKTVCWRLKANSQIIEKHLNPNEVVKYVFVGQKNNRFYDIFTTCIVAITNKRILIGRKRVIFGYALDSVMPYMYNDLNIRGGAIWGKVIIDTIKEELIFSNIDKKALTDIETNISENMMYLKKEYQKKNEK
ncbi:MAG: PH domain-containing protein [Bacilli bacterium]|nr:PH domain-containing protein [Bacilli bacterium]